MNEKQNLAMKNQIAEDKVKVQTSKLLIHNYWLKEVRMILFEKYWLSTIQINKYIKDAYQEIKDANQLELKEEIAIALAQIMEVFNQAMRMKRLWDALKALRLKMDLLWLDAPKKIALSGLISKIDAIEEWDEEARAIIAQWSYDDTENERQPEISTMILQ